MGYRKMSFLSRRMEAVLVVAALFCSAASTVHAQQAVEPVLTAGIDSVDSYMRLLGKQFSDDQLEALTGIESGRPAGLVLPLTLFGGYAFLPVSDFDTFVRFLESTGKTVEPSKGKEGILRIRGEGTIQPLVMTQKGNWAFFAISPIFLSNVSQEPEQMLGYLGDYSIATKAHLGNLPLHWKQLVIGLFESAEMQAGFTLPTKQMVPFAEESFHAIVEEVVAIVNESRSVCVGVQMDDENEAALVDLRLEAEPGSKLAEGWNQSKAVPSQFAGFYLPEATLSGNVVQPLDPGTKAFFQLVRLLFEENFSNPPVREEISEADQAVAEGETEKSDEKAEENAEEKPVKTEEEIAREEAEKKLAEAEREESLAAARKLTDLIFAPWEADRLDAGFALQGDLASNGWSLVAGAKVADTAKFEKQFRELIDLYRPHLSVFNIQVKFDAHEYGEVRLHELILPLSPLSDKVPVALGENLTVLVGTGPESVYLAFGADALKRLKAAIFLSQAKADEPVCSARFSVAVAPLMQSYLSTTDDSTEDSAKGPLFAEKLTTLSGSDGDRVTFTAESLRDGQLLRFRVEEGVLRALIGNNLFPPAVETVKK